MEKGWLLDNTSNKSLDLLILTVKRGFTLIEILIGIAILAILAVIVIAAINPAKRFEETRNTKRYSDVTAIMDAINVNMIANKGVWTCTPTSSAALPTSSTEMKDSGGYDICPCLVTPGYIGSMPYDPKPTSGTSSYTSCTSYNTRYTVMQNPTTSVITVEAPHDDGSEDGKVKISR